MEKDAAHKGLTRDPSLRADKACSTCHAQIVANAGESLHTTLAGFKSVLGARGGQLVSSPLQQGFDNHCGKCHGTCGQCHVSRPTSIGGGLLGGHQFAKTPPMKETCTSCHVTRVGQEYLGENEGLAGDVHWTKGAMLCSKCHSSELHGVGKVGDDRYRNAETRECLDCHEKSKPGGSGIQQHDLHGDKLSCNVCHSVAYKNCYSCHVGKDDKGVAFFKTEGTEMDFKIGLNPLQSPDRPYKYVTLRHAPASANAFDYYGKDLQPSFSTVPTWKYATPHNIQRKTPQNSSCNACHGNDKLFLTGADLKPSEIEANRAVIVPAIPLAR
ncbi:MAG: hypothetical protein HYY30_14005 [Chloroflexi bacterium]|nr:hypothetical protein [Chloroflexota bacterium]